MPKVIISASGMATGERGLHHLKACDPDRRNSILLADYQAAGARGEALIHGAREMKTHGQGPIWAEIANSPALAAHADADEILRWLGGFTRPPKRTCIVHGEPPASEVLLACISEALGWTCSIPARDEEQVLP